MLLWWSCYLFLGESDAFQVPASYSWVSFLHPSKYLEVYFLERINKTGLLIGKYHFLCFTSSFWKSSSPIMSWERIQRGKTQSWKWFSFRILMTLLYCLLFSDIGEISKAIVPLKEFKIPTLYFIYYAKCLIQLFNVEMHVLPFWDWFLNYFLDDSLLASLFSLSGTPNFFLYHTS